MLIRAAAKNYKNVAVLSHPEDVSEVYDKYGIEGLMKIPGVGKGIAQHIIEYLKTGKIEKYATGKISL